MNKYNPEGYHYDAREGCTVDKWGRKVLDFNQRAFRKARRTHVNPARKAVVLEGQRCTVR